MGARRSGPVEFAVQSLSTSTAVSATTTAGTAVTDFHDWEQVKIVATLAGTDGTATGGVVDIYIQWYDGTDWWDLVHFPQIASAAAAVSYSYAIALNDSLLTVGKNTTPLLANGVVAGGCWGDQLRTLIVTGSGCNHAVAQTIRVCGVRPARI